MMKRLTKIAELAFIGCIMPLVPVHAQDDKVSETAKSPTEIVKSVIEADLSALITDEGHVVDEVHPFERPSVRGKTGDGIIFVLVGTACDKNGVAGCQGIMMQVLYDSDERVTTDGVNEANMSEAALSAWWDKTGKTVGFTRYVVLDGGVTYLNIRENLRVLLDVVLNANKFVFP
jgi:hypothetical protein